MKVNSTLLILLLMIMFPQIVETIYSPALGSIVDAFSVSSVQAAQTLSVYFSSFAIGVAVWGIIADKWGRRPSMLAGLLIYGLATCIAMLTDSFTILMFARAMSAFGIAVGSVITQTMLRDLYTGVELGKVFSLISMGIALSRIIGMLFGGQLTQMGGYQYVFAALSFSAFLLFVLNSAKLPETRPERVKSVNLVLLARRLYSDSHIWHSALLVALYNVALFSYYQLGSFTFHQLGRSVEEFGHSGLILSIGTLLGSYLNKRLLERDISQHKLLWLANGFLLFGALGVYLLISTIWFLIPMLLVVMAFGIAMPNVISSALQQYQDNLGSAGALFGLLYYLIIGSGLMLAGIVQDLGLVLPGVAILISLVMLSQSRSYFHT
ncbi:multidrug effflux MFS transporter [Endozoicomonas sp. GU-1]|uniref:multidrug effflux MFS transporter n=1 Tax=Endozoicomonas sp. GU-1 TaxID=3009078 RepID=UPI0022B3CA4F|nr:multidrug effflux MFS transporter [Endozoicomonas sp. GU-1]WBA83365.1 multidrug effflux MFS transporter [Endozoicomonas sp. GU-1]WBA86297.1 multidrug effflux MFS transporter [Endozoicomonas sp. GU-1]